jgi:hypothetical protein
MTGTPSASGTVTFEVTAKDAVGTTTKSYTMTVEPDVPPLIDDLD